jgi:hypothetical protein
MIPNLHGDHEQKALVNELFPILTEFGGDGGRVDKSDES